MLLSMRRSVHLAGTCLTEVPLVEGGESILAIEALPYFVRCVDGAGWLSSSGSQSRWVVSSWMTLGYAAFPSLPNTTETKFPLTWGSRVAANRTNNSQV